MNSLRFLFMMIVVALPPFSSARADSPVFEPDLAIHDADDNPGQCVEIDFPTSCDADPTHCTHAFARLNELSQPVPFAPVLIPIEWTDEWSKFSGRLKAADQKLRFMVEYPVGNYGNVKGKGTAYALVGGVFSINDAETTTTCESMLPEVRITGEPIVVVSDDGLGTVRVELDAPFARDVNVEFEITSETLTLDVDYGVITLSPVRISAGEAGAVITVEKIPGARPGALKLELLPGSDYSVGSPSIIDIAIQP